jgi:prepilin peptidase CpaA
MHAVPEAAALSNVGPPSWRFKQKRSAFMPVPHETIYAAAALGCASLAAVLDVRSRRIPNWLTGPALLFGLGLHLALGGACQLGWSAASALIAGAVFVVFYIAGGMGAGDVKLMAALASIAGIENVTNLLLASVIIGAVFAIALALSRGALRQTLGNVVAIVVHHRINGLAAHPELNVTNQKTLRLPYAVPIAMGCLFATGAHLFTRLPR